MPMKGFLLRLFEVVAAAIPFAAGAGAIRLSEAEGGIIAKNFAFAPETSDWTNGETIPGAYAFRDGAAIEKISTTGGFAMNGGIYSITNSAGERLGIGLLAPQKSQIVFGMAFTNDTCRTWHVEKADFTAVQTGFRNADAQTLETFLAPDFDCVGAHREEWNFRTRVISPWPDAPIEEEIAVSPENLKIPPGGALVFVWRLAGPAAGSSAIAGVRRFEIAFELSTGSELHIR